MDAVVLYLPSPIERNQDYSIFEENFCGRAFKVLHDRQKGPLVFIRLYNGVLSKGQKMYSVQQETSEQSSRLFIAYADELKDVESVRDGSIAVVTGLKVKNGKINERQNKCSVFLLRGLVWGIC